MKKGTMVIFPRFHSKIMIILDISTFPFMKTGVINYCSCSPSTPRLPNFLSAPWYSIVFCRVDNTCPFVIGQITFDTSSIYFPVVLQNILLRHELCCYSAICRVVDKLE